MYSRSPDSRVKRMSAVWAVVITLAVIWWLQAMSVKAFSFAETGRGDNSTKITLEVTYGLKGTVRANGNVPLFLKIINQGESFVGTLTVQNLSQPYERIFTSVAGSILFGINSEPQVMSREIPVAVKAGETWHKTILVAQNVSRQTFEITLTDAQGKVVSETAQKVQPLNETSYVIGVLSNDQGYQQELSALPWSYGSIVEQSGVDVILLQPEELAEENLNQDIPDAIIFGEYHREDLSVSQQMALKSWEGRGGIVIEEAEVQNVNDLLLEALGNANVNEIGARILQSGWKHDALNFELQQIPIREQPNVAVYAVLLLLYAAAAGPGLYLVLKKLQRRYHLWSGMILLALGFVAVIGIYSSNTRVSAPFITYIENIEQEKTEQQDTIYCGLQAPGNSSYNLYLDPGYDLVLDQDMDSYPAAAPDDTSSCKHVSIQYWNDKKEITVSNCPAFGMTGYSMVKRSSLDEAEGVVTQIRVFDGKLNGVVENNTTYDMRNVVILMPASFVWVGELQAGETLMLTDLPLDHIYSLGMNTYVKDKLPEDASLMEKSAFSVEQSLADSLSTQKIYTRENSLLLGEVTNKEAGWQLDNGYETCGHVFYQAPVFVSMTDGDRIYCPYTQQYRSDGTVNYIGGMAYSNMWLTEEEYIATYHLNDILEEQNDGSRIIEVEQLQMTDLRYLDKGEQAFGGSVDFYNYQTQQFERVENWKKPMGREELSPYINSSQEITIRYISGSKEEQTPVAKDSGRDGEINEMLPQIQITGMVKEYAEN